MNVNQSSESFPTRPMLPYIGLDDPHTKDFFNRTRVRKHLRRAGLLNRNGEILSQAEYDSKIKDMIVGRENQRKLDDALTEVLDDMAKEHWGYARNHMNDIKKDVLHQLQRIEEQYRRRVQPITIRHAHDRDSSMKWTTQRTSDHSSIPESPTLILPAIRSSDPSRRSRSNQTSTRRSVPKKDKVRKEWTSVGRKDDSDDDSGRINQSLPKLEHSENGIRRQRRASRGQHEEQKSYEPARGLAELNEDNKKEVDDATPISTEIKQLNDRILNLESLFHHFSMESPQQPTIQTTANSEEGIVDREHTLDNALRGLDSRCKQVENQLTQLLTKLEEPVDPAPRTNVNTSSWTARASSTHPLSGEHIKPVNPKQEAEDNANNGDYQLASTSTCSQENQYAENINHPNHQSEQNLPAASRLHFPNRLASAEDPMTETHRSNELQTMMPFIEFLPTFDMFNEKEWE